MAQTTTKNSVFPGNLVPGPHWQQNTGRSPTNRATATTVDLTFDLVNGMTRSADQNGTPLLTPNATSSTNKIIAWYIKTQTKTQIVVTVEVDQAAGAAGSGKDNTVTMCAYIAGPQA